MINNLPVGTPPTSTNAFVQIGKQRRYHGGKNRTAAGALAGVLKLMPALDAADPLATCNDGRRVLFPGLGSYAHTRTRRGATCDAPGGVSSASASELECWSPVSVVLWPFSSVPADTPLPASFPQPCGVLLPQGLQPVTLARLPRGASQTQPTGSGVFLPQTAHLPRALFPPDTVGYPPYTSQGGPVCYDLMSCAFQPPDLTSSSGAARYIQLGGIFSTGGPSHTSQFDEANVVWLPYCSSDAWMGDSNATLVPGQQFMRVGNMFNGFPGGFRGQRIIKAALTSMANDLYFGATESTRLLLGGCTPGAIANLDAVASFLQLGLGLKPAMVTVSGFFDSATLLDVIPLNPTALSMANITAMTFDYVNAAALVAPACGATYPNETWRCVFGQYALPFVRTPYLLAQPQFDRAQLAFNAPRPGSTPASLAYADTFGADTQALVDQLPTPAQLPRSGVFSSACFTYCPSMTAHFWNVEVQHSPSAAAGLTRSNLFDHRKVTNKPLSLQTALNLWFFEQVDSLRVVDTCTGFRCGQCAATKTGAAAAKKAARQGKGQGKNASSLAGPILIVLFAILVFLGCCLAMATQDPRGRRYVGKGSGGGGLRNEELPLLPRGVTPMPKKGGVTSQGAAAYANLPRLAAALSAETGGSGADKAAAPPSGETAA